MTGLYPIDTIAAIATATGYGGVGIVRVSGPLSKDIAKAILGCLPEPRYALYTHFRNADRSTIDRGIALFFPAPHSFTGEDVLELQGHGGPVVMDMLLRCCLLLGARLARPGEFSERAVLNNKLDLAQAEAIADLIESGSERAARCALRSLQGDFSAAINHLLGELIGLRAYVEAALDFPEEEIDFLADNSILAKITNLLEKLNQIESKAQQGNLLREGLKLVIVGQPNAGKSSLLNQLSGRNSAIVTHIPGTTRDILREQIDLDGMPLHIVDTAGLRDSEDPIEQEGIRRAHHEIEQADLILLLLDYKQGFSAADKEIVEKLPQHLPRLTVYNKIDLGDGSEPRYEDALYISAKKGDGIDTLIAALEKKAGLETQTEGVFIARRRHLDALQKTRQSIENALEQLTHTAQGELVAEELRLAQQTLGEITGKFSSDDLLGEIFSNFCIGK